MGFYVADIERTVAELRERGVEIDGAGIVDVRGPVPLHGRGR